MRVHPGRALFMTVALAESGAVIGACLCWLGFTSWALMVHGTGVLTPSSLVGITMWALVVGAPLGALAAPLMGLSVLRRAPLWRVLLVPVVGALAGLTLGLLLSPGVARLPLRPLAIVLAAGGMVAGSAVVSIKWHHLLKRARRRLPMRRRLTIAEADSAPSLMARCARTMRRALQLSSRR